MNHQSAWSLLERFIKNNKMLKEQYQAYLEKNKDFSGENFCDVLLLFDLFLKKKNQAQKQTRMRSSFLKDKAYKISLIYNRVKHGSVLSSIPWWNQITQYVYLGALPLRKHIAPFKEMGVKRVLSMVEPFERKDSFAGKPVRLEHWEKAGIENKLCPSPDFRPISLKTLYEGAVFVNEAVKAKETVYIHCKAGRGRSAAVVMAYLVLFKGLSYDEASKLIISKRPHIDLENKKNNINVLSELFQIFYSAQENTFQLEGVLGVAPN